MAVVLTSPLQVGVLLTLLGVLGLPGIRLIQVLPEYQDRAQGLEQSSEKLLVSRVSNPDRVITPELVNPNRLRGGISPKLRDRSHAIGETDH